ncbi:isocitrate lyase/phosphoenolpyruvate mutase family protein [Roseobacter sp. YSTF-M11]|uniref:Isocitrate lyase/phosphoenolpyruvate mutase family protein n=2 Tax=Roseobacter insulae TaxID=2859783 RepID=A0A9X1FX37_9RHOB|nr:isocitrate lyase/phosphoenolpyruvate mutase family protein [Roseobacter insulae]
MNQVEKANLFKSLHKKGDPLVLYNIWDAGGARALADAGAKANATGSWSVAAAHGFDDGEAIPLGFALQIVERIAGTVDLPLTVDFEGGYAEQPAGITENVQKVIKAGAIGINLEDRVVRGQGLYAIPAQVDRIKAARAAADREGVPLFINARTDLFLASDSDKHGMLVADALTRAQAYADAGADGFFIPGLTQLPLIADIVESVALPVNVMMRGALETVASVAEVGVSRASFGPGPYVQSMSDLADRFRSLH